MKTTLTVLAVLCLATVANAAINVQVGSVTDLGGGLYSVKVSLVGTVDADKPQAWDGTFAGSLNQSKAFGVLDTPTLDYANTPGANVDVAKDSHFLFVGTDLIVVNPPTGKGYTENATKLEGSFTINGAAQNLVWEFAQLVGPAGTIEMTGNAANGTGDKFATNATIVLPEPATLSLLGLGALALIRRR